MAALYHFLISFTFRCSSGFDRHRQDWVDNSCPDEVHQCDKSGHQCGKMCGDLMLLFFRQRTSYVTSSTPRTSTPLPPLWSPKRRPGAERPRRTGTRPPPPTLPPASPLKVKSQIQIWNHPRAFLFLFFFLFFNQAVLGKISAFARVNTGWHRLNRNSFQMVSRRCRTQQLCLQHF